MSQNPNDPQTDITTFVAKIVATEQVWQLDSPTSGTASCESLTAENKPHEPADVLLFFSDAAHAQVAQAVDFPDHQAQPITLFNFLYRWLPGMSSDSLLVGPDWNEELLGFELDPYDLREAIEAAMAPDLITRYEHQYQELTASTLPPTQSTPD